MAKSRSLSRSIRHPQSERQLDLYETPPEAVEALLRYEHLPKTLWEASCGRGAIVKVLRAHGHHVLATDLRDYASPFQDHTGRDFLAERTLPPGVEAIIQNPPYFLADEFVKRSLLLCPRGYFLLRLQWLESEKRRDLFDQAMLERVLIFRARLPMMHRDGWTGNRTSSTTCFAWFVFNREYRGFPEIRWVDWK